MGRGDARKSTVNYDKLRDGKVVYKRKTNDPEKKAKEPIHQGKRFTLPTTDFEVCRMTSKKKKPETGTGT